MPNYCYNKLKITGPKKLLDEFKEVADGIFGLVLDFHGFIPDPGRFRGLKKEKLEFIHRIEAMPPEERAVFFKLHGKLNRDDYRGEGSEYGWYTRSWGTKWNACAPECRETSKSLTYDFDTAWSPPEPVIPAMSAMFPALKFTLRYKEEGMAFKGHLICKGGETIEEECHDT